VSMGSSKSTAATYLHSLLQELCRGLIRISARHISILIRESIYSEAHPKYTLSIMYWIASMWKPSGSCGGASVGRITAQ
jgi:hypothetical protein